MIEKSLMIAVLFKLAIIFAVGTPIVSALTCLFRWFPFRSHEIHRFGVNCASVFAAMGLGLYLGLSFLASLILGVVVSAGYVFLFPIFWRWFVNYRMKRMTDRISAKIRKEEH